MNLWSKLIAGAPQRRTRLHDELGSRASMGVLIRNLPRAVGSGILRLIFGYLPRQPWISYDAQRLIAEFLANKPCRVIEFGSGQSTQWYAERAKSLLAIEDDPTWHERVAHALGSATEVDYRLERERSSYVWPEVAGQFDLIVIDGRWRDDCVPFALERLAPAGIIYLDNADKSAAYATGDIPKARRLLLDHATEKGWDYREFVDFAPSQLFVQRGLMVRAIG